MSDNTVLNTGTGGDTVATDDIGGVKYPRSKIVIGANGTNDGDVSSANPLPAVVTNAGTFVVQATCTNAGTFAVQAVCTNGGTFAVQAAQSGTWNITNISGTITLPTGASTAAKQPALGTAGTASGDVITVQGVASMTPVQVSQATASNLNATVVGTGTFVVQATCVQATGTNLHMVVDSGTVTTVSTVTSLTQFNGNNIALNTGTRSAGTLRVTVCTDDTITVASHAVTNTGTFAVQVDGAALTSLQLIDDTVFVDDAAFSPATSKVLAIGFQADESSTDSVDEGDVGCPRMTLDRKVLVVNQAHTAGGATPWYNLDVDESEDSIKVTAGMLYNIAVINTTNALLYVKLYDLTVANCTVGTSTPVWTCPVPGNNDTDGAGIAIHFPTGLAFANAITIAATTAAADNDTGAPATGALFSKRELQMNDWYAHIDHVANDEYLVRVTASSKMTSEHGREYVVNGDELCRFEVKSELRGRKLREHCEKLAADKVK